MNATPRSGPLGCLGVFVLLNLLCCTGIEVPLLVWINPRWFDAAAFWRGPVLPRDPIADLEIDDDEPVGVRYPTERWEGGAVETTYTPERGATLETPEGTRLEFPAGALPRTESVRLVPIARAGLELLEEGVMPLGPLYDLQVGGRDHAEFGRPVKMTIPFSEKMLPDRGLIREIAIGTHEDGRWVKLPTTVDRASGTLTAELRHASIEGIIIILVTAVVGTLAVQNMTGESITELLKTAVEDRASRWRPDRVYRTRNFAIYYFGPGWPASQAAPDEAYPLARGHPSGEHPRFVVDIGAHLEDARANLGRVGMPMKEGAVFRYDAYLMALKDYGSTNLGGPVVLDNDFAQNGSTPPDIESQMRNTVTHELIHVAQSQYFGSSAATEGRWWIEATADYLAGRLARLRGTPDPREEHYLRGQFTLPRTPFDRTADPEHYAYSKFLRWMDARGIDATAIVQAVNTSGEPTLASLDRAIRAAVPDSTLGDLFVEFAKDFYHHTLWDGSVFPPADVANPTIQTAGSDDFTWVVRGKGRLNAYASTTVPMTHLTATALNFQASVIPEDRWTKLVIRVQGPETPTHWAMVAESAMGNAGPVGPRTPLNVVAFNETYVVKRMQTPPTAEAPNRATLLLVNASPTRDGPPVTVTRWLLQPPAFCSSARQSDGSYEIRWGESELFAHKDVFKEYRLYRRKKGDSMFPDTPVAVADAPLVATSTSDRPPQNEDYVYTVTVVDQFGNESGFAPVDEHDPFQGEWKGKLRLIDGEIKEPIQQALQTWLQEHDAEERAEIAAMKDDAARSQALTRHEQEMKDLREMCDMLIDLAGKFELAFRAGIPLTLKIRLTDGRYYLSLTHVAGAATESTEEMEMKRAGKHTLAPLEAMPRGAPSMILPLHRWDEIDETYDVFLETDEKRMDYSVRLMIERQQDR